MSALATSPLKPVRPMAIVAMILPFCLGYFMSFYFRTVNALLAGRFTVELQLGAAELGLLTSAYFFTAALMQLPVGFALDRLGPRAVQIFSLAIATLGAAVFAVAQSFWPLFLGRALIGVGVASALVAAIKVVALQFPPERAGLLNGVIIASGAAGAIAASTPSEMILAHVAWRDMYLGLAGVTAIVWLLHVIVAPRDPNVAPSAIGAPGFGTVIRDRRFWRFAPMAALVIGTAWAYHGLWLAVWLSDAAHRLPADVVQLLLLTALTFCGGALAYGMLLESLRRIGIGAAPVMAVVAALVVGAELAMAITPTLPAAVPAALMGLVSAATVVSFTTLRGLFDVSVVGRANGLLNTMNFGMAFAIQSGFGVIVGLGGRDAAGHYFASAFAPALLTCAILKLLAVLWYLGAPSPKPAKGQQRLWRGAGYLTAVPLLAVACFQLVPPEATRSAQALMNRPTSTVPGSTVTSASVTAPPAAAPSSSSMPAVAVAMPDTASLSTVVDGLLDTVRRLDADVTSAKTREEHLMTTLASVRAETEVARAQLSVVRHQLVVMEQALADRGQRAAAADASRVVVSSVAAPSAVAPTWTAPPDACTPSVLARAAAQVTFARDQWSIDESHTGGVDVMADLVRQCPGPRLRVEGFSDPRGLEGANRALSRRRAEQVAAYLRNRGVAPSRIVVAAASPDDRRPRSRRVEVSFVVEPQPRTKR